MEKAYIIKDEENLVLSLVKASSKSKAIYNTFQKWKNDFGVNMIEFNSIIKCQRFKTADNKKFSYIDARNFTSEEETLSEKILLNEIKETLN